VVSAPTAELLAESLAPLTGDPPHAAVFCDIDGTLAPIVTRPEESQVPQEASRLLGGLGRRYGCVACVSGRSATEARRLVGVGSIAYVGSHGAEVMPAGATRPSLVEAFAGWEDRVREFVRQRQERRELRLLRIRIEDKGPIGAFHWRGAPDEAAAETWLRGIAQEAEAEGLSIHWGRKVLEVRPQVHVDKGQGITTLLQRDRFRSALYGGDDVTDLDAFDALDELVRDHGLEAAVRVGVRSREGPAAIVERADIVVSGVEGFVGVLAHLAEA
jgi:trehalose 6-phosphate phosphatase